MNRPVQRDYPTRFSTLTDPFLENPLLHNPFLTKSTLFIGFSSKVGTHASCDTVEPGVAE